MKKVYAFLASGLEEVECLSTVDLLRRAEINVIMVSITGKTAVTGSHGITILADALFEETDFSDGDLFFLPGGMPGTANLLAYKPLCDLLTKANAEGKRLAAICAAPSILGDLNLLSGIHATCYPGWESHLTGAILTDSGVITDGRFTTAKGLGYGIDMGLELISVLDSHEKASAIRKGIQHPNS